MATHPPLPALSMPPAHRAVAAVAAEQLGKLLLRLIHAQLGKGVVPAGVDREGRAVTPLVCMRRRAVLNRLHFIPSDALMSIL